MLTFGELSCLTNAIFKKDLRLSASPDWQEDIDKMPLDKYKASKIFDLRRWQMEALGFQQFVLGDLVEIYMGGPGNCCYRGKARVGYDWLYNHHVGREERGWGRPTEYWCRYENNGFLKWPPFFRRLVWKCRFGTLRDLKIDIPDNVVLKILQVKSLKVLNCFHFMQSVEPWTVPIIVGSICELPPSEGKFLNSGMIGHFFITDWFS